jgi:hypothetical protein
MQFGNATTSIIKRNCFMRATLPTPTTDASLSFSAPQMPLKDY